MGEHFFLLGRSHLTSLWFAWHNQKETGGPPATPYAHTPLVRPGQKMSFLQLESDRYEPLLGESGFHPAVRKAITAAGANMHVSVLGGNDHSMISVAAHRPPFDFVLPEAPEAKLDEVSMLVPAEMLRAELSRRIALHIKSLEVLRDLVPGRIIHLESPPPLPEAHISLHPAPFEEEIATIGIAPAPLRYKLWRLHSGLYQEACARIGIEFLATPPEMRDETGMLLPYACHPDATHGNAIYGGHVLARLMELAG